MSPRDHIVDVGTRRIPYREWGDRAQPTLVLLHGLFGNSHEWDTVAQQLASRRRVVVVDQRGHGAADWASDYRAAGFVADLAKLVNVLRLDTFDLMGHSMGGLVSMLYAGAHPERVRRLIVVDIGPESLASPANRDGFRQMLDAMSRAQYDDPESAVAEWLAGDPLARRTETARWARHGLRPGPDGRWVWRADTAGIGEFLQMLPPPDDLWSTVDRIEAPTLVVHGEHSWALPAPAAHALAARLRAGSLAQIDGAGHDLGVQAPEAVAAQVAAFLDGRADHVPASRDRLATSVPARAPATMSRTTPQGGAA